MFHCHTLEHNIRRTIFDFPLTSLKSSEIPLKCKLYVCLLGLNITSNTSNITVAILNSKLQTDVSNISLPVKICVANKLIKLEQHNNEKDLLSQHSYVFLYIEWRGHLTVCALKIENLSLSNGFIHLLSHKTIPISTSPKCLVCFYKKIALGYHHLLATVFKHTKTYSKPSKNRHGRSLLQRRPTTCTRHSLTVNTVYLLSNDLKRRIQFVYPSKIDIGVCGGRCMYSLPSVLDQYYHAMMAIYFRVMGAFNRYRQSCLPVKFASVRVTYTESNTYGIKTTVIEDIKVKHCDCIYGLV